MSFSYKVSFSVIVVYQPPLTASVYLKHYVSICESCNHKGCCFVSSKKNRCMVPDRNYKLLSTNAEYVPFSTQGCLESISLQQGDTKGNKKKSVMGWQWLESQPRSLMKSGAIIFTVEHCKWFLSLLAQEYSAALVYHNTRERVSVQPSIHK